MPVVGWRAWFTSGRVFDSQAITWQALPDDGALVVMAYMDVFSGGVRHRQIAHGDDWYWPLADGTIAHNSDTLAANQKRYGRQTPFKRGMWATSDEYTRAVEAARVSEWP